jgi:hypothetical protein
MCFDRNLRLAATAQLQYYWHTKTTMITFDPTPRIAQNFHK